MAAQSDDAVVPTHASPVAFSEPSVSSSKVVELEEPPQSVGGNTQQVSFCCCFLPIDIRLDDERFMNEAFIVIQALLNVEST